MEYSVNAVAVKVSEIIAHSTRAPLQPSFHILLHLCLLFSFSCLESSHRYELLNISHNINHLEGILNALCYVK